MSHDGEGIGKTDAFTWFIKDTVPGDEVIATVMKEKKNYGYARLQEIVTPGDCRCEAPCPVARQCGGCMLQNMTYEAQLAFKERMVRNNLLRIGGFAPEIPDAVMQPIQGMEDPWRYRNKAIVPMGRGKDGNVTAGFYAMHTHSIIECADCLLGAPENAGILNQIRAQYDDAIRNVLIRRGVRTGQTMVCIVARKPVKIRVDGVTTVVLNLNDKDTNVILGEETRVLSGPGYIEDYIGDLKFRISAKSFFQVNPVQVEKLYGYAADFAGLTGSETVWDLYCGIGTISLSLAKSAQKVYGVEIVEQAVQDARENAARNGITNAEFFCGKAEDIVIREDFREKKPDVVVVDPPRKGCDERCLDTMLAMAPERIVYVSCDSATLARDLKILCAGGYELKKVQPVDMFPQTVHVECVVEIQRVHP